MTHCTSGLAALVRPLLAAGVPAVAGSLWNVGDDFSKSVLVRFHRHYVAGEDAARALQLAQLDLLHATSAGPSQVISWAPFQVVGYASSPFAVNHNASKRE